MHRENSLCPSRDAPFNVVRVEKPVGLSHIRKHGCRTGLGYGIYRGDIGEGRHDNLIPWPQAKTMQRKMESDSSIADSHRMTGSGDVCKRSLKPRNEAPNRRDP